MKIGGGLNYVVGPMGAGKSYYGVRRVISYVTTGRHAVTNIELAPDWAERVAHKVARFKGKYRRSELAMRYQECYHFEADLEEAMRYRLQGRGESRGLLMWDEGHNDLNNRTWKDRPQELLEWATQLRKLGFSAFLLSQHQDNTDAQLRRVCGYIVRLQNQREQTRLLGMRITPWPLFLACWYPMHIPVNMQRGGRLDPIKIERYFLGWERKLYDTEGLFHGLSDGVLETDTAIWLGAPGSAMPANAGAGPSATSDPVTEL